MVMGDRMSGIKPGAMPWLHQHVGNPVLTGVLNLFFRNAGVSDAHCGMRPFAATCSRHSTCERPGWNSRQSTSSGLEARPRHPRDPDRLPPAQGESLSSFSDGWRHLRFLLVHSPTWLFVLPGAVLAVLGALGVSPASAVSSYSAANGSCTR